MSSQAAQGAGDGPTPSGRLRVLVSAYACEPGTGSETGAGWNFVQQIARFHDAWVITREANRTAIEGAEDSDPRIRWIYCDLPSWVRAWKADRRTERLYYSLWQVGAYAIARRLHRDVRFELAHHVTFGVHWYWVPTLMPRLGVPFVFGPVGGAETAPRSFYRTFGPWGIAYELLRDSARWVGQRSPLVRSSVRDAAVVLAKAQETAQSLRRLDAPWIELHSEAGITGQDFARLSRIPPRGEEPFRLVSVGRLLHWKGFHLGLMAFARLHRRLPRSEYWVIGDGPERKRLERLARRLGVESCVRFLGPLPRAAVLEGMAACDVLVHPSLHDSGSSVCPEAMAVGRPVLCLDIGGPALQVTAETGVKVRPRTPEQVVHELAEAMEALARDPGLRRRMGEAGRRRVREAFDWSRKGEWIHEIYARVASPARAGPATDEGTPPRGGRTRDAMNR